MNVTPNQSEWLPSRARIVYDPDRGSLASVKQKWWCSAELEYGNDLAEYLRWMVNRNLLNPSMHPGHGLLKSPHRPHISIVRGSGDIQDTLPHKLQQYWRWQDGEVIDFEYSLRVRQTGDTTGGDRPDHFWFVGVRSPVFDQIRKRLGLPRFKHVKTGLAVSNPQDYPRELIRPFTYHLTIGRTYD